MTHFAESDWKRLKALHPIALDRYCGRVLTEVANIGNGTEPSNHEKYRKLYQLLRERDNTVARIFNDVKRSSAQTMLGRMVLEGLVEDRRAQRILDRNPRQGHGICAGN